MEFQTTHVYLIYCSYIPDPHFKYSICICPTLARFFWINTEPRKIKVDAQILITTKELPCLKHKSYINTAEIFTFPSSDLNTAKDVGILKSSTVENIKDVINKNKDKYLSGNQIKMVMEKFK